MALDMTTALTIAAKVTGTNQVDGLAKGLDRLTGGSNKAAVGMQRLKAAASNAFTGVQRLGAAAGIAVAAISKLAFDNINAADALSKMSQRTGIAVPALDKFRQAADLSDTSIESMGKGFAILSKNISDATTKGTGPAAEAFNQLGIKLTTSNGKLRESDKVILEIADKFAQMEDGTEKASLAAQLFGQRLGGDLIPLLNLGSAEIQNFGTVMTQEGADRAAAFNDAIALIGERFSKLAMAATLELLPAFEQMLAKIEEAGQWFNQLPEPVKQLGANLAAVAVPVIALAVPLGAIAGALSGLAPLLAGVGVALSSIGPFLASIGNVLLSIFPILGSIGSVLAGIPALIAGWAGAIGPLLGSLTGLGQVLVAIFTGPVGWVTLAVAAGVAIYAFRDQIGSAFKAIGKVVADAAGVYQKVFVDPVLKLGGVIIDFYVKSWVKIFDLIKKPFEMGFNFVKDKFAGPLEKIFPSIVNTIKDTFKRVTDFITAPFKAAVDVVRNVFNNLIGIVEKGINSAIAGINALIQAANKVPGVNIPTISNVKLPRFADGGVVTGPTLAMVGEGGEPEYIVPQSKAGRFAANWMAGMRGASAIPRFAEGGVVVPSNAQINVQTGPVTQMDGTNYVTVADMEKAMQSMAVSIYNGVRSSGGRRYAGVR